MLDESVRRRAFFLKLGQHENIFVWQHSPAGENITPSGSKACAVIVCPTLGHEYMGTHRILRRLADVLASANYPAFRFDYRSTGNASDLPSSSSLSLASAAKDVVALCSVLRQDPGISSVACIGFGLGGSIALLASELCQIDHLILWEPRVSGRRYLRELRALSGLLDQQENRSGTAREAAGVFLTETFAAELKAYDLLKKQPQATKTCLLLHSETLSAAPAIKDHFDALGVKTDARPFQGLEGMLAYPTDTVVPVEALADQRGWLDAQVGADAVKGEVMNAQGAQVLPLPERAIEERIVSFSEKNLFGLLSVPKGTENALCVVFLNCGSEHHVGPHRMYTDFSRQLAEAGYFAFRMDIEGIGDSISIGNNIENYPYSPCAVSDVGLGLERIRAEFPRTRFVLTGICAGAYHSFKASAELDSLPIVGAILVNPLVFHWQEENSSIEHEEISLSRERNRYKSQALQWRNWSRFLKNPRNVLRVVSVLLRAIKLRFASSASGLGAEKSEFVQNCLSKIRQRKIKLVLELSDGEPGLQLLQKEGGDRAKKAIQSGEIQIVQLPGADHGLSMKHMREKLYEDIENFLESL